MKLSSSSTGLGVDVVLEQVPPLCHMLLMQKPELLNHNRSVTFILERLGSSLQQVAPFEVVPLEVPLEV